MKKKLRILLVWILVSLIFQFGGHWLLNLQIQKVMGLGVVNSELPVTARLKASIPGSELRNIQVSYAKDYLAYMEKDTLKVFNLKKEKIIFEKISPSATDHTLGVLTYQWLPDRNILLYFYARKNPNEVTTVKVYPSQTVPPAPAMDLKTEDPNQAKNLTQEASLEPRYEKRYGSPQLTELYSLELPNSDEDEEPNDRLNSFDPPSGSEEISAGGKLEKFVVAASTNLMYLTVSNGSAQQLMKIDVNKKVSSRSKAREVIENMAVSDRCATLYMDSKVGSVRQVVAIQNLEASKKDQRLVISKNAKDRILGVRKGKVYLGEVENNQLVKIKTTEDLEGMKENPVLKTEWQGSIPYPDNIRTLIGVQGEVIVYDNQTAYIVRDGQLSEVKLQGDENYVSADGAELIQLSKAGTSTRVELQPLEP
ncbi:hypothetical protein Desor_0171 [Desulfosporosinus orientis DSM 765]|uniref:Uncharacterized protein n=1 Tax=Desulfosporosinus orientis (strain ATCC 19365 / DSM 765 / NCIMB 8382 / VKM B-1628 / Singapore I) TaxID=768706 RepID=G7W7H2_DESOD|nr:hypothetical protein [Desulfosporosinus orientis]AET65891.1 hypothetical protein Desor_0171 [Desulfosporosinus orientis DSM 765]